MSSKGISLGNICCKGSFVILLIYYYYGLDLKDLWSSSRGVQVAAGVGVVVVTGALVKRYFGGGVCTSKARLDGKLSNNHRRVHHHHPLVRLRPAKLRSRQVSRLNVLLSIKAANFFLLSSSFVSPEEYLTCQTQVFLVKCPEIGNHLPVKGSFSLDI